MPQNLATADLADPLGGFADTRNRMTRPPSRGEQLLALARAGATPDRRTRAQMLLRPRGNPLPNQVNQVGWAQMPDPGVGY